jgi:hypothetical protein
MPCIRTRRLDARLLVSRSHCSRRVPGYSVVRRDYPSRGRNRSTSPPPRVWVPRHVTRLVTPLVVDYSTSRRLVVDYFASAARLGASTRRTAHHAARHAARHRLLRLAQARRRLLHLRRASGCFGTSRGSSRGSSRRSSSTTPPRAGLSSTTSPPLRVRVPRHVARLVTRLVAPLVVDYSASRKLVVDYFASVARPGASDVAWLITRLVVDYFHYAARPGASACRAARHADRRAARRRLLRLRRASGCLDTSRGSSRGSSRRSLLTTPPRAGSSSTTPPHAGSSLTTSTTPRADSSHDSSLVVDYFADAARPGASARRAARRVARCAARRRLLHLRRASGCLGTSRGPSRGSLSTTPCAVTSSCGHTGSTSATPCVVTTCLAATLTLL